MQAKHIGSPECDHTTSLAALKPTANQTAYLSPESASLAVNDMPTTYTAKVGFAETLWSLSAVVSTSDFDDMLDDI